MSKRCDECGAVCDDVTVMEGDDPVIRSARYCPNCGEKL